LNLNFLIKKQHIFKRRVYKPVIFDKPILKNCGIYTINQIRFEFVYLRTIKKVIRKKYIKRKNKYFKTKFWLMIKPNFLLTMKSKNSRMGSGVGSYVRVCCLLRPNKPIILFKYYPIKIINNIIKYLKLKLNINFYKNHLNS
jgi:ribosomal protein L16/L10AE